MIQIVDPTHLIERRLKIIIPPIENVTSRAGIGWGQSSGRQGRCRWGVVRTAEKGKAAVVRLESCRPIGTTAARRKAAFIFRAVSQQRDPELAEVVDAAGALSGFTRAGP